MRVRVCVLYGARILMLDPADSAPGKPSRCCAAGAFQRFACYNLQDVLLSGWQSGSLAVWQSGSLADCLADWLTG
jgi:hypothetical protein